MTYNQFKLAIYATYLTNLYGFKLQKVADPVAIKKIRIEYAKRLLNRLNIEIKVVNPQKLPADNQVLLLSNHRTILDPVIIELATQESHLFGHWVAKKELYNSFFFGKFVRTSGTILLDRESTKMSGFFADIKDCVKKGHSIYIFPEGTRNKTQEALIPFQGGAQIIAMKNRLPILPVYIRSQANRILKEAIQSSKKKRTIEVEIGEIIDYKDRSLSLEEAYKQQFKL